LFEGFNFLSFWWVQCGQLRLQASYSDLVPYTDLFVRDDCSNREPKCAQIIKFIASSQRILNEDILWVLHVSAQPLGTNVLILFHWAQFILGLYFAL
jgi:hypothetical protein